jgi:hypothetical protein
MIAAIASPQTQLSIWKVLLLATLAKDLKDNNDTATEPTTQATKKK